MGSQIQQDVEELKKKQATISNKVSNIQSSIDSGLIGGASSEDIEEIKSELNNIQQGLTDPDSTKFEAIKNLQDKINEVEGNISSISNEVSTINTEIEKISSSIEDINEKLENLISISSQNWITHYNGSELPTNEEELNALKESIPENGFVTVGTILPNEVQSGISVRTIKVSEIQ